VCARLAAEAGLERAQVSQHALVARAARVPGGGAAQPEGTRRRARAPVVDPEKQGQQLEDPNAHGHGPDAAATATARAAAAGTRCWRPSAPAAFGGLRRASSAAGLRRAGAALMLAGHAAQVRRAAERA
jgi:hypothetical protein